MTEQDPPELPDIPRSSIPTPPMVNFAGTPQIITNRRPTAALVIGILLIVFAGFGLLAQTSTLMQLLGMTRSYYPHGFVLYTLLIGLLAGAVNLAMGIGLIKMLPWARKGTVYTLTVLSLLVIVNTLVSSELISSMPSHTGLPMPGGTEFFQTILIVTIVVSCVFSLLIYGLFIYFLTRANVVAAFQEAGE